MVEMTLNADEAKLIELHRRAAIETRAYNNGLLAAANLAHSWGDQCCGGSGEGGDGYRNLADSIRGLMKNVPA